MGTMSLSKNKLLTDIILLSFFLQIEIYVDFDKLPCRPTHQPSEPIQTNLKAN